jgi:hypothetical protein
MQVQVIRSLLVLSFAVGCGSAKGTGAGAAGAAGTAGTAGAGAAGATSGDDAAAGSTAAGAGGAVDAVAGADSGAPSVDDAGTDRPLLGPDVRCFGSSYGSVTAGRAFFNAAPSSWLGAMFYAGNKVSPFVNCKAETFGACTAYSCPGTPPPGAITSWPPPTSAGTVSVTSGAEWIEMSPNADETYTSKTVLGALWSGGDLLTFGTSGGVAPRFAQAMRAPAALTFTAPDLPVTPATIDRTKDLAFSWTGGADGTFMELAIDGSAPFSASSAELRCRYPSADGAGVVPAAALMWLPSATTSISVGSDAAIAGTILVDDYCVDLEVLATSQTADGKAFSGRLRLTAP